MNTLKKCLILTLFTGLVFTTLFAKGNGSHYTKVSRQDIMWKKSLWRKLDLRRVANTPLYLPNQELSTLVLNAAFEGKINAYHTDQLDCEHILTVDLVKSHLEIPQPEPRFTPEDLPYLSDEREDLVAEESAPEYFQGSDCYELELKEDYIFDKKHGRMVIQPVALSLFIPADHPDNPYGFRRFVGSFSYEELIPLFSKAPFYDPKNLISSTTLHTALMDRRYDSYVVKVSNSQDAYLSDYYPTEEAAYWAGVQVEHEIREFEYNLWTNHTWNLRP